MRHRRITSLLALRSVLFANTVLMTVVGSVCFLAYERPAAYVFAALAWAVAVVLGTATRRADPYRLEARRLRR